MQSYFALTLHYVKSVHVSPYSVWMRENADQNNSEFGNFSRSAADVIIFN